MLGTVLLAGAAFGAVIHGRSVLFKGCNLYILQHGAEFFVHGALVVAAECGGNVHAVGAGHTLAAAGASHLEIPVDLFAHRINQAVVGIGESACFSFAG